jgi:hypothetical protein
MPLFDGKFTNIFWDGEVPVLSPDAQGDFYLVTDAQQDHIYMQEKVADSISAALNSNSDFLILYGGVVTDGGSGKITISEGVVKGKDNNGNKKVFKIPALTAISIPSGWNDGRAIWVTAKYDFKLSSATRDHRSGTNYHYQLEDTYMGDSAGFVSTSLNDLFTATDPAGTATILGKFTMTGTTFVNQSAGVRTALASPQFSKLTLTDTSNQIVLGTTRTATITAPTPATASRVYTIPDPGANANFVMTESAQNVNGAKTFGSQIAITPTTNQLILGASSGNRSIISATAQSADRTFTIPGATNSEFVMTAPNQTIAGTKTFSGVITSNVVTGTAPLSIASTTKVNNLHVDRATLSDTVTNGVYTSGDQTINGIKTFGSIPLGPASDPTTANQLTRKTYVDSLEPIGTVKDFDKDFGGTPALTAYWKECDGSVISDAGSPYNGKRIRNLNGANVILTLTWTANAGGSFATVNANDITALNVGDWVTGTGIAANSLIKSIVGTTVTITDIAATGSKSTTFTNDGIFVSGQADSGLSGRDEMQRMTGTFGFSDDLTLELRAAVETSITGGAFTYPTEAPTRTASFSDGGTRTRSTSVLFDSTNSPNARTSTTTAGRTTPHWRGMVKIMRIK